MARSSQYSRSRRIAMQVVMWLLLAATVGWAALISRGRSQARRVRPAEQAVRLLSVDVRLPAGWGNPVVERTKDKAAAAVAERRQQASRSGGRVLYVSEEVVPTGTTVTAFLANQLRAENVGDAPTEPLEQVAGFPGTLVEIRDAGRSDERAARPVWAIYAAAIVPPDRGVLVTLTGLGSPEAADREDVRRIAAAMRATGDLSLPGRTSTRPATRPAE